VRDEASPHTARGTITGICDRYRVIPSWPPHSPHLNLIELGVDCKSTSSDCHHPINLGRSVSSPDRFIVPTVPQREPKWSGTQVEEPSNPFSPPIRQLFQQDTLRTSLPLSATLRVPMMHLSSLSTRWSPDGKS
jgi:hypothetical protein